jgi:hypothetical protein
LKPTTAATIVCPGHAIEGLGRRLSDIGQTRLTCLAKSRSGPPGRGDRRQLGTADGQFRGSQAPTWASADLRSQDPRLYRARRPAER